MTIDETTHEGLFPLFKRITRGEPGIASRVFLSLILGCILVAIACGGSWIFALLNPITNARTGGTYFRVSDANLTASFSICGLIWTILLHWIWRGNYARVSVVRPLISTVIVIIGVTLACVALDELVRREEEFLMTAVCFIGGAIGLLIWMRFVERWLKGKAVVTDDNQINVACPQCGYSLVGLYDLRCPECGSSFTIDGLIRAQGYAKSAARKSDLLHKANGHQRIGSEIASVAADAGSSVPRSTSASAKNARMT